ncbi:MAG TPA: ATP synthase F1 subunit delta [Candidatus Baltobacteraceae bacterium]|nr:ATP synthase F1 subunit delta [Candidatus Baltobacteraceae bacterium]
MANETLARRYATAIFSLASEANAVERVGNDLSHMARAIYADDATSSFFIAPTVPRSDKEKAFAQTFRAKVDDIALHTLLLLVRKRREAILNDVIAEYRKLELQARGAEPLVLTTARELSESDVRSLVERLERVYSKKFEVTIKRDPSLIGGVRVTMGDRRIDGSVAGRLEELTRTLFAQN